MPRVELVKTKDVGVDDFIETGQIEVGDKYPDMCCKGFEWEVVYIYDDSSIWGECQNVSCPIKERDNCISRYGIDDIIDRLLSFQME